MKNRYATKKKFIILNFAKINTMNKYKNMQ